MSNAYNVSNAQHAGKGVKEGQQKANVLLQVTPVQLGTLVESLNYTRMKLEEHALHTDDVTASLFGLMIRDIADIQRVMHQKAIADVNSEMEVAY